MVTSMKERLSERVKRMKTHHGVSYSHLARKLGVHSQTVLHFANGRIESLGEEKCEQLWKLIEPFFPEPKNKEQVTANEQQD